MSVLGGLLHTLSVFGVGGGGGTATYCVSAGRLLTYCVSIGGGGGTANILYQCWGLLTYCVSIWGLLTYCVSAGGTANILCQY